MQNRKYQIAIFASGSGSNAERIAQYFSQHESIEVSMVLSNKANAGVFDRMRKYKKIDLLYFTNSDFLEADKVLKALQNGGIDLIILAGFLLKIPAALIKAFPKKIINIHPSLLPKYGGRGMYGKRVHEAAIQNGDKISGITIHEVNEVYDEGEIIFQANCSISEGMTADELAAKVQQLEHQHFPSIIEAYVDTLKS